MSGLAFGVTWLALGPSAWADTRRFALIAGANDGGSERVALRYAITDARAFADVLEDLGGVARANQTLLVEPNRDVFADAIRNLAQTVGVAEARGLRTEVVVYYSGHSDETGLQLGETTYEYQELKRDLETIGADVQVVVLDSCASGALVRTKGGVMRGGFLEDASNDVEGTAYLMSATADEAAQESDAIGGSFFTHYLVTGLRGGADHTQDGRVTLHEAYEFAKGETLRRTERTSLGAQHATHSTKLGGHGDFVFTDLSETPSSLVFDAAVTGQLFVRDDQGRLMAELSSPGDRDVELALAPGAYTIVREHGGARGEAVLHLGDAEHLQVAADDFHAFTGERVVARGPTDPPVPVGAIPGREVEPPDPAPAPPAPAIPPVHRRVQGNGFIAKSDSSNVQFGLIGADSGRIAGGQFAYVFARAASGTGVQAAVATTIGEAFAGFQVSMGANIARGVSSGWQSSLGVNFAEGTYTGVQSAPVNVAHAIDGVQVGVVNHAREARGVQVGVVNSGGHGKGVQVGVVNVAEDYDGASIAVVSVHKHGYNHVFGSLGTNENLGAAVSWGSRYVYTGFQVGLQLTEQRTPSGVLAVGGHLPLGSRVTGEGGASWERGFYVDADAGLGYRHGMGERDDALEHGGLARFRALPGFAFGRRFAVQAGVVVELPVGERPAGMERDEAEVSWMAGLRF